MPESDLNIVKPVEVSQNIAGPTPTKRREQRKRRHQLARQQSRGGMNEQPEPEESLEETNQNSQNQRSIDYRA